MNAIFERTSTRQYTDKEADAKTIETILRAGMCAPSAVNKQPWEFIVLTDKGLLEQTSECSPYAGCLKNAAFGIVVLANKEESLAEGYDIQDCAACSENMLVEACDLGLGGVWLGFYPEKERMKALKDLFHLPENIEPLWVLSFGYPARKQTPMNKWKPAKIHVNGWHEADSEL